MSAMASPKASITLPIRKLPLSLNAIRLRSGDQALGRGLRGSHEFGAYRARNRVVQDAIDFPYRGFVERPARHLGYGVELVRPARSPERNRRPSVEDPA